jgi:translation initiation factor 1 (eIF-1/SUI1)
METIKKQINELNLELFYCTTIWKNTIELQGHANKETFEYCNALGIDNFELKPNGFLEGRIDNIRITLTN